MYRAIVVSDEKKKKKLRAKQFKKQVEEEKTNEGNQGQAERREENQGESVSWNQE
jgi:hypothetical protein